MIFLIYPLLASPCSLFHPDVLILHFYQSERYADFHRRYALRAGERASEKVFYFGVRAPATFNWHGQKIGLEVSLINYQISDVCKFTQKMSYFQVVAILVGDTREWLKQGREIAGDFK